MSSSNEGKACHAVIKVLESELGHSYSDLQIPENIPGMPPVDLLVNIGKDRIAIEHTLIEAFAGQIASSHDFEEFFRPIDAAFKTPLPIEGVIYVHFPIDTRMGRENLAATQEAIQLWIRETALRLAAQEPHKYTAHGLARTSRLRETKTFAGIQVEIIRDLHWSRHARFDGKVMFVRLYAGDIESQRKERISLALSRKLQKLRQCKQHADTTILILENGDIALTNEVFISQALEDCFNDDEYRQNMPDAIFQVDTFTGQWQVYRIKSGLDPWLHQTYGHDNWEFAESDLANLTGR